MTTRKPNFFIVGALRSGTTSMFSYLRAHPQVGMCARKEPHFFCDDLVDPEFVTNEQTYLELFRDSGDVRWVGEASPWYLVSTQAARRISEFNPDARIIALLRNPMDMALSLHRHHVFTGFEALDDFETAYRAGGMRSRATDSFRKRVDYSRVARYGEQLARFYAQFPPEQIHVVLFDEFRENPAGVYRSVIDYLEIDPGYVPDLHHYNPQRRFRSRAVAKAVWRMRRAVLASPPPRTRVEEIGRKVWRRGIGMVSNLNSVAAEPDQISPQLRQEIIADYADDVRTLGELIGRDLSGWLQ